MPKLYSIRPTWTFRGRRFRGLRGFAGKPFHPPLTDFPITCYLLAGFCDVVSYIAGRDGTHAAVAHDFFSAGTIAIVFGFVVSLGTALTGFMDWWKGLPRDRSSGPIGRAKHTQVWRTANWHMTVMLTVTAIVMVDILVRWSQFNEAKASILATVLSVVAAALVTFGAGYGGALVFEYQFNVEDVSRSTAWDETETDESPSDRRRPPASS
jgi:uncharacterized membrane protein